jgi:hypothetical protein
MNRLPRGGRIVASLMEATATIKPEEASRLAPSLPVASISTGIDIPKKKSRFHFFDWRLFTVLPASDSKIEEGAREGRTVPHARQTGVGGGGQTVAYCTFVRSFVRSSLLAKSRKKLSFFFFSFFFPPTSTHKWYVQHTAGYSGYRILDPRSSSSSICHHSSVAYILLVVCLAYVN